MICNRSALAIAMSTALGLTAVSTAEAAVVNASFQGLFAVLGYTNYALINSSAPYSNDPSWGYGRRTPISGSFSFDTSTGFGAAVINPFEFFNGGPVVSTNITLQAIGDGFGGAGSLIAGGMLFDWNASTDIRVGIVFDAAGFFAAGPYATGQTISGVGAIPASNDIHDGTLPIGAAPLAATTWNTDYEVNPGCVQTNSCLTSNDTIGGEPIDNGPFPGNNINFDLTYIHIDSVSNLVPVPAAAWLFASGLLSLVGVARRRV